MREFRGPAGKFIEGCCQGAGIVIGGVIVGSFFYVCWRMLT
jgi:hypothetical protein